jgi:hypothetical protein
MQGLALEMLVDHYPLRNAVLAGYEGNLELHSMRLLAEAMAGSEVLLLVATDSTEDHLKPLTFSIQGKTFLIAGTTLEYAENPFVQYLGQRVVDSPMMMQQMDARDLVLIAVGLGDVDGILFDMNIDDTDEGAFDRALLDSMLLVNETTHKAVTPLDTLMESESGEGGFHSLPSPVLSLLAREEDADERRKTLSGYLSHRSRYELGRTVFFVSTDEDINDDAFTTLARAIYDRMLAFDGSGADHNEHSFVPVTALEWLAALARSWGKRVKLDGNIVISGRFARSVLGIENSGLPEN